MSNIDLSGSESAKYKIVKKLGAGSFGDVYKAYNKILNEYCALKIIPTKDPNGLASSYREAEIPNKCRNQNIVLVKTADPISITIDNGTTVVSALAIEMELLNGGSIEELLHKNFVPVTDSINYAVAILSGLQYAHLNNVVHCDIKPGNILLDEHNHPKISDFGLAFFANAQLVNDCVMPFYCSHGAPELRNSQSHPNILTDIYAFGVTFFRMVNNISDWNSAQMYAPIKHAIETGGFGSRCLYQGYVPGKIIRIIAKACNPNPQKRYQTASEMRNALLKLKPWLNWHPVKSNENKFNWLAEDYLGNVYSAEIQHIDGDKFIFRLKKNNRNQSSFNCDFYSRNEALDYLYKFLADHTFC